MSQKYEPDFSNWKLIFKFSFDQIFTQTSFLCLFTSSLFPFPYSPGGLLCLAQAVCLCLTVVLLPIGWDDQAEPSIQIMSFLAGREICNSNTHCAFLTFRTLPGIMRGPLVQNWLSASCIWQPRPINSTWFPATVVVTSISELFCSILQM